MQITILDKNDPNADALYATLQEIVENFEDPFELVREFISNAADCGAKNVWIRLDAANSETPLFEFQDDGEGLRTYTDPSGVSHDRLKYFFQLGKSDKRGRIGQIGRKGFGSKICLLSDHVRVESRFEDESGNRVEIVAELDEPYKKINNRDSLIVTSTTGSPIKLRSAGTGTKISVRKFRVNAKDEFYNSLIMEEYIRWFTGGGSIRGYVDPSFHPLQVHLEMYGRTTSFEGTHNPPPDCDPAALNHDQFSSDEIEYVDGMEVVRRSYRYAQRVKFDRDSITFNVDGQQVTMQVCAWILGRSAKNQFASDKYIPDRDRFGLWLAQNGILVQRKYSWITSSPLDCNYHVIVNCDQFELNADRTAIKGKSNRIHVAVHSHFERFFKPAILASFLPLKKLKSEEESQKALYEIRRENRERTNKLSERTKWPFPTVALGIAYEPESETEVCALLCALQAQHPSKFTFKLLALFPRGTDAAVEVAEPTTGNLQTTMYEVETVLSHFITHGHPPDLSRGIICWRNDMAKPRKLKTPQPMTGFFRSGALEVYQGHVEKKEITSGGISPTLRIPVVILKDICLEIEASASSVNP